ncbi:hypothetical protein CPB85DRAFT_1268345, partial [Mucidula mucida]
QRAKEAASRLDSEDNPSVPKTVTYIDYEDPPLSFFKMTEAAAEQPHISVLSDHSWIAIGEDKYILECHPKGHICVEFVRKGTSHGRQMVMKFIRVQVKAAAKLKELQSKEQARLSRLNVSVGPLHAN